MRKLETLFKEFINAPIQIYSGATFKKGLYSLLDLYDNTVSGDTVIVKGNHDIGNNSIQLKDGVNWQFIGNPTISSDSANGTFKDGGVSALVMFDNSVNILNTSSTAKRIVLTSSSSSLRGISFSYLATIFCEGGEGNITKTIINDFDSSPVFSYDGAEEQAFVTFVSDVLPTNANVRFNSYTRSYIGDEKLIEPHIGNYGANVLNFRVIEFTGVASPSFSIQIGFEITFE